MQSKSKLQIDHDSSLTPSKSILNKKNLFINETSAKKKSGKMKKIEVQTRSNTKVNSKIGKK